MFVRHYVMVVCASCDVYSEAWVQREEEGVIVAVVLFLQRPFVRKNSESCSRCSHVLLQGNLCRDKQKQILWNLAEVSNWTVFFAPRAFRSEFLGLDCMIVALAPLRNDSTSGRPKTSLLILCRGRVLSFHFKDVTTQQSSGQVSI